jgi:hypothetical protein
MVQAEPTSPEQNPSEDITHYDKSKYEKIDHSGLVVGLSVLVLAVILIVGIVAIKSNGDNTEPPDAPIEDKATVEVIGEDEPVVEDDVGGFSKTEIIETSSCSMMIGVKENGDIGCFITGGNQTDQFHYLIIFMMPVMDYNLTGSIMGGVTESDSAESNQIFALNFENGELLNPGLVAEWLSEQSNASTEEDRNSWIAEHADEITLIHNTVKSLIGEE